MSSILVILWLIFRPNPHSLSQERLWPKSASNTAKWIPSLTSPNNCSWFSLIGFCWTIFRNSFTPTPNCGTRSRRLSSLSSTKSKTKLSILPCRLFDSLTANAAKNIATMTLWFVIITAFALSGLLKKKTFLIFLDKPKMSFLTYDTQHIRTSNRFSHLPDDNELRSTILRQISSEESETRIGSFLSNQVVYLIWKNAL